MKKVIVFGGLLLAFIFTSCTKDAITVSPSMPAEETKTETPADVFRSDEDPVPMRGHVRNASGQPISGAGVTLTIVGQSSPAYSTSSGSDGSYGFGLVEQHNYAIAISATGYITKIDTFNLTVSTERTDTLQGQ